MVEKNKMREKIIKVLSKHPEGLPILTIAKLVGSHRHTITKYVYELIGSGIIYQRRVGSAKLCYLKEDFIEKVRKRDVIEKLRKKLKRKK